MERCLPPPPPPRSEVPPVHRLPREGPIRVPPLSAGPPTRKLKARHQRNLSLDFRSEGIILPPLPPSILSSNHHQRNRSLDSVLQKIPETEGSELPEPSSIPTAPPLKPSLSFTFSDSFKIRVSERHRTVAPHSSPGAPRRIVPLTTERVVPHPRYDQTSLGSDDSGICSSEGDCAPQESLPEEQRSEDSMEEWEENSHQDTTLSEGPNTVCEVSPIEDAEDTIPYDAMRDSLQEEALREEKKETMRLPSLEENVLLNESLSAKIASEVVKEHRSVSISKPLPNQSSLLRLFESKHFDMSMAVSYMYKCKEPGVQQYIGNKLFSLSRADGYFYLPQLVNMYVQSYELAEILHPYLIDCCRHDIIFALHCAWLLEAFGSDTSHQRKKSHGTKLKQLILSDELRPKSDQDTSFRGICRPLPPPSQSLHRTSIFARIKEHPSP